MPRNLKRYSGAGDLHFIICSCYHRRQYLASARRRDLFLTILEQVRQRYRFVVLGYVVMPEHFHLLISEPDKGNPCIVMQVLKQRFARRVLRRSKVSSEVAQHRFWNLPTVENANERREDFVQPSNCPTQAKIGLEWATRPFFHRVVPVANSDFSFTTPSLSRPSKYV